VAGGRAGQFSVIVFYLAVHDGEVDASESPSGFVKVARSMMAVGSKMVMSAK